MEIIQLQSRRGTCSPLGVQSGHFEVRDHHVDVVTSGATHAGQRSGGGLDRAQTPSMSPIHISLTASVSTVDATDVQKGQSVVLTKLLHPPCFALPLSLTPFVYTDCCHSYEIY